MDAPVCVGAKKVKNNLRWFHNDHYFFNVKILIETMVESNGSNEEISTKGLYADPLPNTRKEERRKAERGEKMD